MDFTELYQDPNGIINVDLAGFEGGANYDQITVNQQATLDGKLFIRFKGCFLPVVGDTFEIIKCQSYTGQFEEVVGADICGVHVFDIVYDANGVSLITVNVAMPGDFTHNDIVEIEDLPGLTGNWLDVNCPDSNWCNWADLNYDGNVNLLDFAVFAEYWLVDMPYVLDNFDDNLMGSLWDITMSDELNAWLQETSQQLEFRAESTAANAEALYIPNGWHIDKSKDFAFRIKYHFAAPQNVSELILLLGADGDYENSHLKFSVRQILVTSEYYYEFIDLGVPVENSSWSRGQNDGWLFVSYDSSIDELYFGTIGYGKSNALKTTDGVLQGSFWLDRIVAPAIGGMSNQATFSEGQAYWDDFIIDSGKIIFDTP